MTAPLRYAADRLLRRDHGDTLDDFVTSRRAKGMSWRQIARDLLEATDEVIDVSPEALRLWYLDADLAA